MNLYEYDALIKSQEARIAELSERADLADKQQETIRNLCRDGAGDVERIRKLSGQVNQLTEENARLRSELARQKPTSIVCKCGHPAYNHTNNSGSCGACRCRVFEERETEQVTNG